MKAQSNIPLPIDPQRWIEGQLIHYFNPIDNGEQDIYELLFSSKGMRYEAEFMITKEEEDFKESLVKYYADPELCESIKDNIEVDGVKAIEIKKEYEVTTEMSTKIDAVIRKIPIIKIK